MFLEMEENETAKPFGVCLQEARKSLGLSLEELSKTLNLDIDILEALENSDIDALPPAIYVQGYIKAYTKALGISSSAIHADYLKFVDREKNIELKPRSQLPSETNSQTPIVKTFTVLLGVLALSAALFGVYNYYSNKVDTIEQVSEEGDISQKILIPQQDESIVNMQDVRSTDDVEPVVSQSDEPEVVEDIPAEEISEDTADLKVKDVNDVITGDQDSLKIVAEDESWADIRDNRKERIYFGLLKKGDFMVLAGTAPFDIFLGNAADVVIEINEVKVDMSDYIRNNNVAHFRVSEKANQIIFH